MVLRTAYILAGVCTLLLMGSGCTSGRISDPASNQVDTLAAGTPARSSEIDIRQALECWSSGDRDRAVMLVLKLYDVGADAPAYRPFTLTEEEAIALPRAEREALTKEALDTLRIMRHLGRELHHRAKEAHRNGDDAQAARLLGAMKRLGQANRGPEVMHIVDLVGKAIEQLADKALFELTAPDTEENTRTP